MTDLLPSFTSSVEMGQGGRRMVDVGEMGGYRR